MALDGIPVKEMGGHFGARASSQYSQYLARWVSAAYALLSESPNQLVPTASRWNFTPGNCQKYQERYLDS
jgi:hypothetical protein